MEKPPGKAHSMFLETHGIWLLKKRGHPVSSFSPSHFRSILLPTEEQQISPSTSGNGSLAHCHHLLSWSNPSILVSTISSISSPFNSSFPELDVSHTIAIVLYLFIFNPNSPLCFFNAFQIFSNSILFYASCTMSSAYLKFHLEWWFPIALTIPTSSSLLLPCKR